MRFLLLFFCWEWIGYEGKLRKTVERNQETEMQDRRGKESEKRGHEFNYSHALSLLHYPILSAQLHATLNNNYLSHFTEGN